MEHSRFIEDFVPEDRGEHRRGVQLHLAPDQFAQFHLHAGEVQEAGGAFGQELHEDIYITGGTESVAAFGGCGPEDASEEREPCDMVSEAELRDRTFRELDAVDEHGLENSIGESVAQPDAGSRADPDLRRASDRASLGLVAGPLWFFAHGPDTDFMA